MARQDPSCGLWGRIGGTAPDAPVDPALLARFATLTSPALVAGLLSDLPASELHRAVPAENVERSRLLNRLRRITGLRWARKAMTAGIDVVCIKCLGTAHCLYADPDQRAISDTDLLVRPGDYRRLVAFLEAAGLVHGAARTRSPWGFVSDASLQPMGRSDGASNLDLHIHPDAWPLHRALGTDDLFARARTLDSPEGAILVPEPTDMLLLATSHAARDLFGPRSVKTMVDAMLLLRRAPGSVDWQRFEVTVRRAWLARPARAFLSALEALGGLHDAIPAQLARPPAGAEFRRMLADYEALFPARPDGWARLRREWCLAAEPRVAAGRGLLRLKGLVRPRRALQVPEAPPAG